MGLGFAIFFLYLERVYCEEPLLTPCQLVTFVVLKSGCYG